MRATDPEKIKDDQKRHKAKSIANLRAQDNEKVKEDQKNRKRLSMGKKRAEDNKKVKCDQNSWQANCRQVENAKDRLKEFKAATLYNAIFVCTCCHQRMFQSNVQEFNENLKEKLNSKIPGLIQKCIPDPLILTTVNGKGKCFICKTCVRHLKMKKMPPMSTENGLKLVETDKEIKHQNLELTELEGALIAKNILFQKIYQLPKSRWTALKDRVINVPINEDSIINTLEQMPRTPKDAGLIGVALKRKIEYKNTHKHQLIDPEKLFKVLEKLKKSKNPHYKFYDDYNVYQERCKEDDPLGYEVIFEQDYDVIRDLEDVQKIPEGSNSNEISEDPKEEEDAAQKDEIEFITKDPVKKYQFKYNEALCMTDKYPEISVKTHASVNVAPGEGQVPKDIMTDDDWDVKAFPHLHNPDGSNGKDQERKARLTDQNYFIQRICNKEKRFAKSAAYMYAAVAYIEKKQINRNINLAGTRGRQVTNIEGGKTYELEDAHRVLEDIKNTPRYWKKAKYEMLAKLDNLGPFQLFFTLSCADMRWDENFAAILLERGYETKYEIVKDEEENWVTMVNARKKGGDWKLLKQFLEEDVDESLHELIRGNVLTATRYFQHRLKSFIKNVIMGKSNPMCASYYTYKVEFQDRGAGHIHGTLWLRLDDLENMERGEDGELKSPVEKTGQGKNEGYFNGLKLAFSKLRKNQKLLPADKTVLSKFIDEFTTVSIHGNTVGKCVAEIAQEVNKHHHTKTCRKYDTTCRFNYPRFPAPETIIVSPCCAATPEEREERIIKYREVLKKVKAILEDDEAVSKIMEKYDKQAETKEEHNSKRIKRIEELCKLAGVDYNTYLMALGTSKTGHSVVQKRDLDEIYINSYNIEWLRAWNGNMDIQIVLDYFAVITYVTDYYAKDDTGTMEVIKAALAQTKTNDLKEKMRTVANVFLTHRQMGEAEAVYRLLPSLTLKKSNVTCQWVSLGMKEERSSRWRKATEEDCKSGRPVTELAGHEGFWYEQQDMWSKYLRRPVSIEDVCFAQFAKMFRSGGIAKDDDEEESDTEGKEETDVVPSDEKKFHYIITCRDDQIVKLPEAIVLDNPYPRESPVMKKRSFPAVLRFNKAKRDDPLKFMLHELMLYRPTRNEFDMDKVESLYNETFDGKSKVSIVKKQVMEHLEGVEEARYYVEQVNKEINLTEIGDKLDPELEQDNADCEEEADEDHPDFLHIDPGQVARETDLPTSIYRRIELPSEDTMKENTRALDYHQRQALNIAVKYAKDVVKARKEGNASPTAPLLMVHGGAGAGKSTVINVLAQWTQKILQKEGDDIECPCVLKAAFTGTAASNIEGQTLHSSFGFSFDNKHYSLSDKNRDQKRAALRNLKIVIIDEISMVKADMLYQLDLRLQEIMERVGVPFGGVSVFTFGDMMQLKPCMGRYICDDPIGQEFQIVHAIEPRWRMFQSLILETNHRQGNDKEYAELLNRVRIGEQTQEDMQLLRTRVRPAKHHDLKEASLYIVCKRKDCARINTNYIAKLKGKAVILKARHHHPTQKNYKPYIEQKEGAVATTSFLNELILKIGAKVMIIHNIDTTDSLTNGQLGVLIDMIKTTKGKVDKLIIKLNTRSAGRLNRSRHPGLASRYPDCVIIERVSNQYTLRKKSGDVSSTAIVMLFPIKLAFAITSHKIQGQTIPWPIKVVLDINSVFEDAQAHVMLSRVQQLEQIFILDELNESKIRTSKIGLEETKRLAKMSINANPSPWQKKVTESLKIVSLNCAGLKPHFKDIGGDGMILKGDIIHLIETSLEVEEESPLILLGYDCHLSSIGRGKGIATYYKASKFNHKEDFKTGSIQITKFSAENLDVMNVYRSSNGNSAELLTKLLDMVTPEKPLLITGDFNICFMNHGKNRMSKGLMDKEGLRQLMTDPTHILGGHIDHIYWRNQHHIWKDPIIERYSPYYSDHDASCITLIREDIPKHK